MFPIIALHIKFAQNETENKIQEFDRKMREEGCLIKHFEADKAISVFDALLRLNTVLLEDNIWFRYYESTFKMGL